MLVKSYKDFLEDCASETWSDEEEAEQDGKGCPVYGDEGGMRYFCHSCRRPSWVCTGEVRK
ncbi:MAG TPA: hypothetical protein ACFYD4_16445 [Candidatus Wunengus sp. YC61]|uniref:hypothetical protein n=1 Tax=Candidatus Wunengus sp. YC61 TaxID=3367698 RepID=UPI00402520D4